LLELGEFGLTEADLGAIVSSRSFREGTPLKLREIVAEMKAIYCGTMGVEYMHIQNPRIRHWIRERVEARAVCRRRISTIREQRSDGIDSAGALRPLRCRSA
jgi:2-oxoglutarate dehydrogenase complex dehydrogenase (E1) component-like enzyme